MMMMMTMMTTMTTMVVMMMMMMMMKMVVVGDVTDVPMRASHRCMTLMSKYGQKIVMINARPLYQGIC